MEGRGKNRGWEREERGGEWEAESKRREGVEEDGKREGESTGAIEGEGIRAGSEEGKG